jgi:hypothetical protein
MNRKYRRGSFLESGTFSSEAISWASSALTTTLYGEAQRLKAIWYTLREDPDFTYT